MRRTLTLILGVALFGILAAVVVASQGADDPAGTTGTMTDDRDAGRTTTMEDNPARQGADDDSPAQGGVDISGPCDEAEHANDPRCGGQAPATRRRPTRPPPRTAWTSPARVTRPSTPTTRAAPARRPATTAATTTGRRRPRRRQLRPRQRQLRPRQLALGRRGRRQQRSRRRWQQRPRRRWRRRLTNLARRPAYPSSHGGPAHHPDGGGRGVHHRSPVRGPRSRGLRHAGGRHGRRGARKGRGSRCPTSSSST